MHGNLFRAGFSITNSERFCQKYVGNVHKALIWYYGVNNTKNVNPTSVVPHTIMEVLTCMHGFFYDKLFVVTCMHGLGFNREV